MKFWQTAIFLAALATLGLPGNLPAQTLLRWKLQPGEAFGVDVQQHTTSTVAFSGKTSQSEIDLGMELGWTVKGADDKGFDIEQVVRRVQFKLQAPGADAVAYDSAARSRPAGLSREIARAVEPLLGAQVSLRMTARGEIVSAKPANEAAEKLFAKDAPGDEPGVFSRGALQKLLGQSPIVLPEKEVQTGDTWTATEELDSAVWQFGQVTTYRLAEPVEQDGRPLQMIEATGKLVPAAKETAAANIRTRDGKLVVKAHEQSGTIRFDAAAGRLVESEAKQSLTTERPYRETTIVVTLASTQTTTLLPN
ncbi:MAG: DUF6263 family protein [Pirellulaceae bacterium]